MKRALIVGIDQYPQNPLSGCVNDAIAMQAILERNDDASPNMHCRLLTSESGPITRSSLRAALVQLFSEKAELALFYFAGHGIHVTYSGGYLVTSDMTADEPGVGMQDVLNWANEMAGKAGIPEVVIILDCCDS